MILLLIILLNLTNMIINNLIDINMNSPFELIRRDLV